MTGFKRDIADYKKFDGQPFSSRLYADLLLKAGVDEVITVHNHSCAVKNLFMERFSGRFSNLQPADVYAGYMQESDIVNLKDVILCAPDKGAVPFVHEVKEALNQENTPVLVMDKVRKDEREVDIRLSPNSPLSMGDIKGKDIVVIDDMVRTGQTIIECCRYLKKAGPRRIVFFVTHFYSSQEGKIYLNDPALDEIVTTNTIPSILNRDMQGRLRHKMVVLLIERWISSHIFKMAGKPQHLRPPLYRENMSSKNPRWKGKMGPLFS
jgi:ribose-phosphate pyrophosphokinase